MADFRVLLTHDSYKYLVSFKKYGLEEDFNSTHLVEYNMGFVVL